MTPAAEAIWSSLEFRKPMMLRNVEPLSEELLRWQPAPDMNSIAWQLWYIAEVEDNWIRTLVTQEPPRFPFDVPIRKATPQQIPPKQLLLDYLSEIRAVTRHRLEVTTDIGLEHVVEDPDFGTLTVREVWAGIVTSFAWHAGQIALTAKLAPGSPVTTMQFNYWRKSVISEQ